MGIRNRYVMWMGATFLGVVLLIAGINLSQNPYDVFRFQEEPVAIRKSSAVRMAKAYALRRDDIDCLILGSSRAEVGIPTAHPGWDCQRVYNAGLPSARIYESRRYFEHALTHSPIRHVVLGLDLIMFRSDTRSASDFSDERLSVAADGRSTMYPFKEVAGLVFGIDSLRASLFGVDGNGYAALLPWGNRNPAWWQYESDRLDFQETAGALFQGMANRLQAAERFQPDAQGRLPALQELAHILDLAERHDIRLDVFFNPMHASFQALLAEIGRLDDYVAWKGHVAEMVATRSSGNLQLWDFGLLVPLTSAELKFYQSRPPTTPFYWEPSHFRQELGTLVLDRVLAASNESAGFGTRVHGPRDIVPLPEQRQAVAAWVQAHPDEYRQIKIWLSELP